MEQNLQEEDGPGVKLFEKYFIPRYDELTLYLHGISFIILICMSDGFRDFLLNLATHNPKIILTMMFITAGTFVSIYNAFVYRKKSDFEKNLMLIFAIFSNALIVFYTLEVWNDRNIDALNIYNLPVIINMAYTIFLVLLLRFDGITISSISDDDVPVYQVIAATIPVIIAFIYFEYIVKETWNITYSWCVFVGILTKDSVRFVVLELLVPKTKKGQADKI